VRSIDIPARYGGEEFAVLCPETDLESAITLAERLRSAIEETYFQLPTGDRLSVTVSVGVARYQYGTHTEEDLIAAADAALYQSKRMGRNQVQSAELLRNRADTAEFSS
jgi:diguanylate cyclase (GGDEF)-like protein